VFFKVFEHFRFTGALSRNSLLRRIVQNNTAPFRYELCSIGLAESPDGVPFIIQAHLPVEAPEVVADVIDVLPDELKVAELRTHILG
jgi:hypothetical protein